MTVPASTLTDTNTSLVPSPTVTAVQPSFYGLLADSDLSTNLASPYASSVPEHTTARQTIIEPSPITVAVHDPTSFEITDTSKMLFLVKSSATDEPTGSPLVTEYVALTPSRHDSSTYKVESYARVPGYSVDTILPGTG